MEFKNNQFIFIWSAIWDLLIFDLLLNVSQKALSNLITFFYSCFTKDMQFYC